MSHADCVLKDLVLNARFYLLSLKYKGSTILFCMVGRALTLSRVSVGGNY